MPPAIKWKTASTPQRPYNRRQETAKESVHTAEEWEAQRKTILKLRSSNEVKDIVTLMAGRNFVATEAQFKYHLKKWGDLKYTKLTGNQLDHIAEGVAEKHIKGERPAVRLNGMKVPSERMRRILLKKREDYDMAIVRDVLHILELEAHEKAKARASFDIDDHTTADSLRISIYTSSTMQGIRRIFPRRRKAQNRIEEEDSQSEASTGTPRTTYSQHSEAWKSLSEKIFRYRSLLDFEPSIIRIDTDQSSQFGYYLPRDKDIELRNDRRLLTVDGLEEQERQFLHFLSTRVTNQQLYFREIDTDDCPSPETIWAVDIRNVGGITATTQEKGKTHAWCVREGGEQWVQFYENISSRFGPEYQFQCGHTCRELREDGPVIFTSLLHSKCWAAGGCQFRELEQLPHEMHWSATKPLVSLPIVNESHGFEPELGLA